MIPRIVYPHGDRGDLGVLMPSKCEPQRYVVRWRSGEVDDAGFTGQGPGCFRPRGARRWHVSIAGQSIQLHAARRPGVTVEQVLADHHEATEAVAAALDGVV